MLFNSELIQIKQLSWLLLLWISNNYSIIMTVLVDNYDFMCYVIYSERDKNQTEVEEILHDKSELT
jgi:hypothetical protein